MPRYRDLDVQKFPELLWLRDNCEHIRTKMRLSQGEFAKLCGMSQAYYWSLENLKANPTVEVLSAIARNTGVPASKLLLKEKPRVPLIDVND